MKNKSFAKVLITTFLTTGLTMVSSFLLARLLAVEERGALQLFITSVTYVVTIATGGVGFSLALCMRQQQYQHWRYYFSTFLLLAIFISSLALYFFNITSFSYLFILNVILTALFTITLEKSKIDANLSFYRLLSLQQPILAVGIYGGYYFLFGEQHLEKAVQLLTLLTTIQAGFALYVIKKIESQFTNKAEITPIQPRYFLKNWLKQNLLQTFGATTVNLDRFLIVSLMGNYTLGLYTVCIAFDALFTRIINMLADYYYSGLLNGLNRIRAVLGIILLMGISAVIIVPFLAEPVIHLFFGNAYIGVAPILLWFIINSLLAGLSWLLSQNMLILGKQVLLFTRQIISILVLVGLFFAFQNKGLYGVAYALIGASLVRVVISIIYYYKFPIKMD
ncbi:lipopolysaccharide biosynthesis protein [Avibacterium paragallinarum]|uniref:lipopolysaccharide biosynthesis protein n=1 Tax=Avibacterium paragallinarum TaxID=728 RepID=UPI00397D9842